MAVSCLAIALTPNYDAIGAWASFFFFISRALQVEPICLQIANVNP
jgi:hypothetical protein